MKTTTSKTISNCYKFSPLNAPYWQKLYIHLPKDEMKALTAFVNNVSMNNFQHVFSKTQIDETELDHDYGKVNGSKRCQWLLPQEVIDEKLKPLLNAITEAIQPFGNGLVPMHPFILHSEPNGPEQEFHPDFALFTFPRYGAIFSLNNATKLNITNIDGKM